MRVVLLGPPGAGKGTQADRIADRFQLVHVATGDILRANVADGTSLGEVAQAYLDSGELVPDQVVVAMMLDRLTRPDCGHGFLLDGFPRSVAQARALDEHLAELGTPLDAAINLEVAEEELLHRLAGRGRADDNAQTVRNSTTTTNKACCSAWPRQARSTRSPSASFMLPGTSRGVPYLPAANQRHRDQKELTSPDHRCRITGRCQARARHDDDGRHVNEVNTRGKWRPAGWAATRSALRRPGRPLAAPHNDLTRLTGPVAGDRTSVPSGAASSRAGPGRSSAPARPVAAGRRPPGPRRPAPPTGSPSTPPPRCGPTVASPLHQLPAGAFRRLRASDYPDSCCLPPRTFSGAGLGDQVCEPPAQGRPPLRSCFCCLVHPVLVDDQPERGAWCPRPSPSFPPLRCATSAPATRMPRPRWRAGCRPTPPAAIRCYGSGSSWPIWTWRTASPAATGTAAGPLLRISSRPLGPG